MQKALLYGVRHTKGLFTFSSFTPQPTGQVPFKREPGLFSFSIWRQAA